MAKRSKVSRGLAVYMQLGFAVGALSMAIALYKGKAASIVNMQDYVVSSSNFNEDGSATLLSESSADTAPSTT